MSESWVTEQELTFLKNLGTYREGHEIHPMRLKLLANYVKAAPERVDWGNVNGEQVIQFAEDPFTEERLKAG
jgi:hypothetical protein